MVWESLIGVIFDEYAMWTFVVGGAEGGAGVFPFTPPSFHSKAWLNGCTPTLYFVGVIFDDYVVHMGGDDGASDIVEVVADKFWYPPILASMR